MKPKNLKYVDIDVVNDFATNIDIGDSPKSVAVDILNYRNTTENIIAEKDYGTKHVLPANSFTKVLAAHFMVDRDTAVTRPLVIADTAGRIDVWLYDVSAWKNLSENEELWSADDAMTFAFHEVYAQNKVIIIRRKDGADRYAPIVLRYEKAKSYFLASPDYDVAKANGIIHFAEGYKLSAFGLPTDYVEIGSATNPLVPVDVNNVDANPFVTKLSKDGWLGVTVRVNGTTTLSYLGNKYPDTYFTKYYITAIKDGYMESDPIFGIHVDTSVNNGAPVLSLEFSIDWRAMDSRINGLVVYAALGVHQKAETDIIINDTYGGWTPADADMLMVGKYMFDEYYTNPTKQYDWYKSGGTLILFGDIIQIYDATEINLYGNLGHAVDVNRSVLKPKFLSSAEKTQGSVVVADQDDGVLRLSSYDGYGVHEDENFPDVTLDATNGRQKIFLTQNGKIFGIEVQLGQVYVFKRTSLEVIALGNAQTNVYPIDCVSPKSIVKTPHGIVWAGVGAIYILPINGGRIEALNTGWSNMYNGSLKFSTNNIPYIADADKENIVCGYNPYFDEVWCEIVTATEPFVTEYVNYRFSFKTRKWMRRKIQTVEGVNQFITSISDSKLYIVCDQGILAYPNTDTDNAFMDCVPYNPVGGRSYQDIVTRLKINIGELHSLPTNYKLYSIMLNYTASMPTQQNTHAIRVNLYGDYYDVPLDFVVIPLESGTHTEIRQVKSFGQIERLMVEIDSTDANCDKLNISRISLGILADSRQNQ